MTLRFALILLAVCASFATVAPTVQAQDSASIQCPPSDSVPVGAGAIQAFG